jgi:hypothetical protein
LQKVRLSPQTAATIDNGLSILNTIGSAAAINAAQNTARAAFLVPTQTTSGLNVMSKAFPNQSRVDLVIKETMQNNGMITSQYKLSGSEVLQAGEKFLGTGYKEIGKVGSGVYRSADRLKQFRIDSNSLLGKHAPGVPPVHLELYESTSASRPYVSNHISFFE